MKCDLPPRGNEGVRMSRRRNEETSYDEASRGRFGSGGNLFGFGAGGNGLPQVFGVLVFLMLVVVGRLVWLQVVEAPRLSQEAQQRRTSTVVLQARRGTIYDRNGNVLAMSEECYDVYCNPKEVADADAESKLVAHWLGGVASDYRDLMVKDSTFVYLSRMANKEACESLRSDLISQGFAGVYLIPQTHRVYPFGQVAGQILGMVNTDGKGVSGIELAYNEVLAGKNGQMTMETGLGGIPVAGGEREVTEPINGGDIVLAIDKDAQMYAEQQIEEAVVKNKAKSGFCMVCNPKTGEIIAACSTPYADLSNPETIQNEALNLKLVSDSYEPGSIFKVLTAAIGIESGTVDSSDYFTVPPTMLVGQDLVEDEDGRTTTMDMNLREVLRRSSNVGMAQIAQDAIGADAFAQGVSSFKIGELTGIDYPGESVGLVKNRNEYDPSSLGSMSFGQGIACPMVQMVRAVGSIANDGMLVTPHFVLSAEGKTLAWEGGERSVSVVTANKVVDMMRTVVEEGTGESAAVEGYDVAAKTGTGEQAENGKYVKDKYLASLIGFAPAKDPEVLVYVGLNETPYMSYSSAGPVFSAIMGEVLADLGVPSYSREL